MQGVPPIVPDSPQPLAPSGLVLHGAEFVERDRDRRNVVGARQAIVLIARGQQLPFVVVGHAFVQRLADALRDAAVNLPGHQHRIDGDADVVDRGVAHDAG